MSEQTPTKKQCPKVMPRAKEQCGRSAGHKGRCLTEYAIENSHYSTYAPAARGRNHHDHG